jgi:hypothetical protein
MMSKARHVLGSRRRRNRTSAHHTSRARAASADVRRRIVDFEKEFGTLPLSLRVFYEVGK